MHRAFHILAPLVLVAALVLSGCDLFGSDDSARVTLNAAAANGSGVASKTFADHVDIGSVDLLFKSIRFHTDADAVENGEGEPVEGEDEGNEGSAPFHTGPVVVTITPDGGTYEIEVADVPAGTYEAISFHLHKPRGNQEVEEFPEFAGETSDDRWSIVVWTPDPDGDGPDEPAVIYRSALNVVQEVDFDEPFDVEDGASHFATLTVDLAQWFVGPGGQDLDPADGTEQNRALIDQSIRNSFRLFPDEDEDAAPDQD